VEAPAGELNAQRAHSLSRGRTTPKRPTLVHTPELFGPLVGDAKLKLELADFAFPAAVPSLWLAWRRHAPGQSAGRATLAGGQC
jgi:hypothetical protein